MNKENFDMIDYTRIFAIIISLIAIVISFTVIFRTHQVTGDDVKTETNNSQLLGPVSDITYQYDTSSIDFLGKSEGYVDVFSCYEDEDCINHSKLSRR